MTYEDTLGLMSLLKAYYPAYYRDATKDSAEAAANAWYEILCDYDTKLVAAAMKALISANKFPPSIAEVIEKINFITQPRELTELEAWSYVQKALRNSTYHATEEFDKLPPIVKRIVRTPEQLASWAIMDEKDVNKVISSNFQRSYKAGAKYEKDYVALPDSVKKMVDELSEGFRPLPALEASIDE